MNNQPLTDKSPQFDYQFNTKHYRPIPSEWEDMETKLDKFSSLLSIKNSLYFAIDEQYQNFVFRSMNERVKAAQVVHYDLMMIAQILQEKIELEFQLLSEFIQAQQPQANQGGE
ncbi:hypothetical protein O1Q79_00196 [Lonepinella sp. MS14434]